MTGSSEIQEANELRAEIVRGQIPTPIPGRSRELIVKLCLIVRSQNITIQVLKQRRGEVKQRQLPLEKEAQ